MPAYSPNLLAVTAAAASGFVLGGLWYSPALFARVWMAETGLNAERLAKGNPVQIYGVSFVLCWVAAYSLAMFFGGEIDLTHGALYGLLAGVTWVAASFGVNYLFERKSLKLWLVNGGYHAVQFTLMGVILGAWR